MSAISRALNRATETLQETSDTARLDAELLMAASLGIARDRLLLDPPAQKPPKIFEEMIERRANGEPVAYITGQRAFWTIDLEVGPGVLIPRPDSETLLLSALEHFSERSDPKRILDLGTGPGTLLLAALDQWPEASGLGIDSSERALGYALRNAARLGMAGRSEFRVGDWARGIEERFDLVLCNPPYVARDGILGPGVREYEPAEALFAGDDGLDDLRTLAKQLPGLISEGGLAAIEIGFDQAEKALQLFENGYDQVALAHDLADRPRAVILRPGR